MKSSAVSAREIIDILTRLVQRDSSNPPGDVRGPAEVIVEVLDKEGIGFEILESKPGVLNVVARLEGSRRPGPEGLRTLLLNGHLDTVPPGSGWTVDPFGAEVRGGYLFGRGTTDMKAGVAASLMSVVDLRRRGCPFAGSLVFTAVGDEEFHSQYGTKWLIRRGLAADCAVVCEPTNLDLCLGNRGLVMIDIVTRGVASHAGRPGLGKNAISTAARIVHALESLRFEEGRDGRFKDPVGALSVVGVHGGARINVIPDRCEISLDRRLMPKENSAEAISQVERAIEAATGVRPAAADQDAAEIGLASEVWHEPFWIEEEHPFVRQCVSVYRAAFGRDPVVEGKSAGTDASHLTSMARIPTVIFGPGDYRRSHTVDECVELSQLLPALGFYSGLVESVLKGAPA